MKQPRRYGAKHGTEYSYKFHHCRCDACKQAHAERLRKQKAARVLRQPLVHGTTTAYVNWDCRCDLCRVAGSANNKAQRAARKARAANFSG